jgi:hypothetical protein
MAAIGAVANQFREIKAKIEELRRIEIDVAVLKSQLTAPRKKKPKAHDHDEDTENGSGD